MESNESFIYGRRPLEETLNNDPDRINKIFLKEGLDRRSFQKVLALASSHHIPVQFVPGRKLMEMVGKVNDQGCVAQISEISYKDLDDWLDSTLNSITNPLLILLDEIEDPHNFGAILRSAAATGVNGVVVPKHRQAPVTPAVLKASAGTAGFIPIFRVVNINQAILKLKENGFWIMGLDQNADHTLWEQDYDMPVALVVGNEGKGIRQKTLEHCDFTISIPMSNHVESLNASVSTALVCYEIFHKRNSGK